MLTWCVCLKATVAPLSRVLDPEVTVAVSVTAWTLLAWSGRLGLVVTLVTEL